MFLGESEDSLKTFAESAHIGVTCRNYWYNVSIYHKNDNPEEDELPQRINAKELEQLFERILQEHF